MHIILSVAKHSEGAPRPLWFQRFKAIKSARGNDWVVDTKFTLFAIGFIPNKTWHCDDTRANLLSHDLWWECLNMLLRMKPALCFHSWNICGTERDVYRYLMMVEFIGWPSDLCWSFHPTRCPIPVILQHYLLIPAVCDRFYLLMVLGWGWGLAALPLPPPTMMVNHWFPWCASAETFN